MPHFQRPFLKFVYEKPSTHKRVSAKTDEADAQRLDGTDTAVAAWRDAIGNVDALLAHQDDVLYGNTLASLAPSSSSSPSKAPMLMTYEERMEKNRLAKEATRKDRIAAEKHRLTQIMADQAKQREWKQTLVEQDQALVHRSACRLQTWFCHVTFLRRYAVKRSQYAAAVVIQCLVRTRQARRMYRRRTDERRQRNEAQAIHAAEQILERQMHVATAKLQHDKEMEPILRLWTDIQQAIQRASSKESNVFSFFDQRHAGQVDRAVLRRQLLQLGFDVPRQVVRRLIQLIHSRANVQSDRLVVTADQFTKAFDLTTCIAIPPDVVAEVPPPPWTSANASPESNAVLEMTEASPALAPAVPTINSVEGISMTFRQLRERIVHAARVQFGGGECSSVSFASLRAALVKLFEWFDQHGSGDVALADFKACLETHLHVAMDAANWEYVRECFDADGSGSVNIAEFVAFAFADASVDEMGVLGYQLRDAILHRVKAARKDAAPTIEDAVRLVFHPVFHRRDDATFADFCHALAQLQLGFTLGQLSRLDKNHLISLDELLGWLKLKRSNDTRADTTHDEPPRPNTEPGVSAASAAVKQLRRHLVELAGEAKPHAIKHLFESIDTNQSAKLSASELHAYLGDDTAPLSVVEAAVACMDARRQSVVSKADFISFCLDTTWAATDEEVGVVVEQCRTKLCDMCADAAGLRRWFGALAQHQGKVRTAEFKRALKAMVHLPEHELDGVVRRLDFDGSGWISDKEFHAWVHPVRDIEVLLTLVERHPALQQMGAALFAAFDVDGNGVIGIDEFHAGLKRFHIDVNTDEAAALLAEFDVNADGVLSASELHAMAEAYNSDELDLAEPSTETAAAGYDDDFEDS
ncbi:hypothetical protein DYB30_000841 [Aphanomyces astaci]|uniref:EF-hand domain-containing protein n=1 Tax=Aphanomyces astaci TaxID=112090 RepID=A0A397CGE7_APHAT|nr:hypothetical protein DYB30_000841 [Aphanomyces astaci]RHZ22861.1 hypothetical protein DYB26_000669 [Aphanomyces astaci]